MPPDKFLILSMLSIWLQIKAIEYRSLQQYVICIFITAVSLVYEYSIESFKIIAHWLYFITNEQTHKSWMFCYFYQNFNSLTHSLNPSELVPGLSCLDDFINFSSYNYKHCSYKFRKKLIYEEERKRLQALLVECLTSDDEYKDNFNNEGRILLKRVKKIQTRNKKRNQVTINRSLRQLSIKLKIFLRYL